MVNDHFEKDDANGSPDEPLEAFVNRCQLAFQNQDVDQYKEATEALFEHLTDNALTDDSPEWQRSLQILDCEQRGDWVSAQTMYLEDVEAVKRGDSVWGGVAAHNNLAALYRLWGKYEDSFAHASQAYVAAQSCDSEATLAMTTDIFAATAARVEQFTRATKAVDETLNKLVGEDATYNLFRGKLLARRAAIEEATGLHGQAADSVRQAMKWIVPYLRFPSASGAYCTAALAWTVMAKLAYSRGETAVAADLWGNVIETRREIAVQFDSPHTYSALADSVTKYSEFLAKTGNRRASRQAKREADKIRQHWNLSPDK